MEGRANKRSNVGLILFHRLPDYRASRTPHQVAPEVEQLRCRLAPGRHTIQF